MLARELMRTPVAFTLRQESAIAAARRMWLADCGALPVVDPRSRPIGVVTDRDLLMAAIRWNVALDELPVMKAMSRQIFVCREDDDLAKVEKVMCRHQVRRVPVVDRRGVLSGIVCLGDLAKSQQRYTMSEPEPDPEVVATILEAVVQPTPRVVAS